MSSPMSHEHRRSSIPVKYSYCSEGRGSFCSGTVKTPLQSALSTQKRVSRTSLGGQLFLCMIGSLLSFSICVWLTAFSQDVQWRRLLFAAGAALCALLFAMLAVQTMRKAKQPPPEPVIPNLAARRSTIVRTARKSMCESSLNRDDGGMSSTNPQQPENPVPKRNNAAVDRSTSLTAQA
ncbi:unnamed protein product [Gongylonema pulchrum]|uniref:Transmembrane protein n=1 Tax=Gongylonema pulchrum TaxID=637853 RepID=A0A183EDU3_9BILA|nr:unnamed protein product [Gongylonema pulchrum]